MKSSLPKFEKSVFGMGTFYHFVSPQSGDEYVVSKRRDERQYRLYVNDRCVGHGKREACMRYARLHARGITSPVPML